MQDAPGLDGEPSAPITQPIKMDLRALEYLPDYDHNLTCPICHSPFVDAVKTKCGHVFCKDCLRDGLQAQDTDRKTCPACRTTTRLSEAASMPRLFDNLLDELKVNCVNKSKGCKTAIRRGDIQAHMQHYCDFEQVSCPGPDCNLKVLRKELDIICKHKKMLCQDCGDEIVEIHKDQHEREECSAHFAHCPDCSRELVAKDLAEHTSLCPMAMLPCTATEIGCKARVERQEIEEHEAHCTMVALLPILRSLTNKVQEQSQEFRMLQRRTGILEDGLRDIQDILARSESSVCATSTLGTNAPNDETIATSADPVTHHLLSLHESLRGEVESISSALSEVDARSNMMIMNESLRMKEESAHQNAAIAALQMQVRYLLNSRLQTQRTQTAPVVQQVVNGPATAAAMGLPIRRLSDSSRQDVKL